MFRFKKIKGHNGTSRYIKYICNDISYIKILKNKGPISKDYPRRHYSFEETVKENKYLKYGYSDNYKYYYKVSDYIKWLTYFGPKSFNCSKEEIKEYLKTKRFNNKLESVLK